MTADDFYVATTRCERSTRFNTGAVHPWSSARIRGNAVGETQTAPEASAPGRFDCQKYSASNQRASALRACAQNRRRHRGAELRDVVAEHGGQLAGLRVVRGAVGPRTARVEHVARHPVHGIR